MSLKPLARNLLIAMAIVGTATGAAVVFDQVAYAAGKDDVAAPVHYAQPDDVTSFVPEDATKPIEITVPEGRTVVVNGHTLSLDDPNDAAEQLWDYARSGRGRLTIGPIIVLLVWLARSKRGLGRFAWFTTPLGGYTLGFGTTAIFYFGTMYAAGKPMTFNLVCDAAVTAFAASGKWEALRDALQGVKQVKAGTMVALMAGLVFTIGVGGSVTGCAAWKASGAGPAIYDCAAAQFDVDKAAAELREKIADPKLPKWSDLYNGAKVYGPKIGGCALAIVVNEFLSNRLATPTEQTWDAHGVLEEFRRNEAHGATFRTSSGDL